ncbi:hypothetical protein GYMLUDRAFT_202820 [Collybiopsis luxurians FD-317 M1]|uniref:Glucosamine 6-phosphate N-acetyltransferase n=1 Tax=Collybiopsis luxurians FD-317 M1 TaxID=944289 RepID=A0A0D0CJ27_9AGAR|nr:hypothetical protein GYMLUDRAFT_202820 [Collybiopsis luxurians FD-317 M1]
MSSSSTFTPDHKLDLFFPADLISPQVKTQLHPDVHVRPLSSTDYHRGYLSILSVLTQAPDVGYPAWLAQFNAMRASPNTYFPIVIVSKATDRIVGVGCVFIERKFLRGLGSVGHIEDIAVDKNQQGKKLGLRIIQALTDVSEKSGCYKTILNCSDENIPFYEKCGFQKKENEMAKYAPERSKTLHKL